MRLSVLRGDSGYIEWARRRQCRVFFEDVEIRGVLTADDEAGYVLAHVLDAAGRPVLSTSGAYLITKELHGRVRIEEQQPTEKAKP